MHGFGELSRKPSKTFYAWSWFGTTVEKLLLFGGLNMTKINKQHNSCVPRGSKLSFTTLIKRSE